MNLGQLRSLCVAWLDDKNQGYFTSDQMNVFLNNAQREAQKLLLQAGELWYVKCVQTTTVANQTDYILPTDFLKIHRLELSLEGTAPTDNTTTLEPITLNQKDLFTNQAGTPQAYYLKKDRIVIWPAPDAAKTMRMEYSYLVTDMVNDTDVPDVPPQYHEFIAILATIDGFLKDGREASMMITKKEYYQEQMKRDAEARREDSPRMVVVTRNSGWDALF